MNVFFIKRRNEYLCNADSGYFSEDMESALFFGSENGAKAAIGEMSRKGHAYELVGANIVRGSFEPIDGYDAINTVLKIGRWKKLYSILINNHTPAELMLLTGCQDAKAAAKLPIYAKIQNLSSGFKNWGSCLYANDDIESCFKMFKKLAFYAMNEKFKRDLKKESV